MIQNDGEKRVKISSNTINLHGYENRVVVPSTEKANVEKT